MALIGSTAGLISWHAEAAGVFRIPDTHPTEYDDIAEVLDWDGGGGSADEVIPVNLDEAMCGGWDMDEEVNDKIARTDGIPGHKILGDDPLSQPQLGMAARDDTFDFPGADPDTCGFFTACVPGDWPGPQPARARGHPDMNVPDGHVCQRPLDGYRMDLKDSGDPVKKPPDYLLGKGLRFSCGNASMNAARGRFCEELNPRGKFGGLCADLNEFQYTLWQRPYRANVFVRDAAGNKVLDGSGNPVTSFEQVGWRRKKGGCMSYRGDKDVDRRNDETSNMTGQGYSVHSIRYCCTDDEVGGAYENCTVCTGQECADGKAIPTIITNNTWVYCFNYDFDGAPGQCTTSSPLNGAGSSEYVSYFRHYMGSYEREPVAKVPDDDHERQNVPVACYGLWWDFDPKQFIVPKRYWRCVISVYYKSAPYADQFFVSDSRRDTREKNRGKGDYKLDPLPDDPAVDDDVRKFYQPSGGYQGFDDEKHFWFMENSDTIAYFNKNVKVDPIDTSKKLDISFALLNLDNARARSAVQESLEAPLSSGSLVRSFDDSVNNVNFRQVFTVWWQRQQSKAHKLDGPRLRVLLPASWKDNLDLLQPLISPAPFDPNDPAYLKNPKQQTVEVVMQIRDDLLGDVQRFLERSILTPHREEVIPVVVPAGSAADYRARAHGWCKWWQGLQNADGITCDDGPAADLIDKLEEYADRIDEVRAMRAEIDGYAGKYLEMHKEMTDAIITWMDQNFADYDAYVANLEEFKEAKEDWEEIAEIYQEFEDDINMPWCRNDRFTLPIYSFLDPWWPRPDGYDDDPPVPQTAPETVTPTENRVWLVDTVTGQPQLFPDLPVNDYKDIVLDLSHFERTATGVVLPVIKPVEVSIDWETLVPPLGDIDPADIPELPDLPPVPTFKADIIANLPPVTTATLPSTVSAFAPPQDLTDVKKELAKIKVLIQAMSDSYKIFWDTMSIDPYLGLIQPRAEEDCYRVGLNGGVDNRCNHVEADLIERFTRLGSRPALLLHDDLDPEGLADFRDPTEEGYRDCKATDWTCQLLNRQYAYPKEAWKITTPHRELQDSLNDYRKESYDDTLRRPSDPPEDLFPYSVSRERIVPSFAVPGIVPIYPIPHENPPVE